MDAALKFALAAVAVGLLVVFVDLGDTLDRLSRLDGQHVLLTAVVVALAHGVNALKLRLLLPERSRRALFAATLAAQAYGLLLPGQIAGEVAKACQLGIGRGAEAERIVSSVMFDKMTGIVAGLLVTLAGLASSAARFDARLAWGGGGLLVVLCGITAALCSRRVARWLIGWLEGASGQPTAVWRLTAALRLEALLATWRQHGANPGLIGLSLLYGVAAQGLAVAGAWILALGLGVDLDYGVWCAVIGALTIILLAPVTIGGLGLREASLVGMLGLLGVTADQALAVALTILAFQLAVAAVGVAVSLLISHDPLPEE